MAKRAATKKPESPDKSRVMASRVLVSQPHGGALLSGGGGHRGGTGRPPSLLRHLAREAWASRIDVLTDIADGVPIERVKVGDNETEALVSAKPGDRIRAMDSLASVGLAGTVSVDEVLERLKLTLSLLEVAIEPALYRELLPQVLQVWKT